MEIKVIENVMQYNKQEAELNKNLLTKNNIFMINILSAPGAGKTSLILETIKELKELNDINIGVIEGDIASTFDSEKIKNLIDDVIQINTGGTCHLNASMIYKALEQMDLKKLNLIFIENVGNLICPVGFDLGENYRILISSVSEGDDKPIKYPKAFIKTDLIVLNKIDMIKNSDFNITFFENNVRKINSDVDILKLSCKTKDGFNQWINWVRDVLKR